MELMPAYCHRLVFRIDADASKAVMDKWESLKAQCESGDNKHIVEQMKEFCKSEGNRTMPYLRRREGGMGGNDSRQNKQIRFRDGRWARIPRHVDADIVLDQLTDGEREKWKYEELDDIVCSFTRVANTLLRAYCVRGCIEMTSVRDLGVEY